MIQQCLYKHIRSRVLLPQLLCPCAGSRVAVVRQLQVQAALNIAQLVPRVLTVNAIAPVSLTLEYRPAINQNTTAGQTNARLHGATITQGKQPVLAGRLLNDFVAGDAFNTGPAQLFHLILGHLRIPGHVAARTGSLPAAAVVLVEHQGAPIQLIAGRLLTGFEGRPKGQLIRLAQ